MARRNCSSDRCFTKKSKIYWLYFKTMTDKKKRDSAHPGRVDKTSEFIGIVVSLLSVGLQQRIHAIKLSRMALSSSVRQSIGFALISASVLVLRKTHQELARYNQPHEPGKPTTVLVVGRSGGPFRYSRNPTYAAIIFLMQPGLAFLLDNGWMMVTTPLSMALFWYILLREEEEYLKKKFGDQWEVHCRQTRRWI